MYLVGIGVGLTRNRENMRIGTFSLLTLLQYKLFCYSRLSIALRRCPIGLVLCLRLLCGWQLVERYKGCLNT